MTTLRHHHRGYSFFWDLVDLARSAFHYTASFTPPALVPVEVPAAVAPQLVTPARRRAHNHVA